MPHRSGLLPSHRNQRLCGVGQRLLVWLRGGNRRGRGEGRATWWPRVAAATFMGPPELRTAVNAATTTAALRTMRRAATVILRLTLREAPIATAPATGPV